MVEKRTCYRNDGQPLLSYGEALFLVEDSEKEIARLKAENRELRELLEEGCDRLKCWKDHDCGGMAWDSEDDIYLERVGDKLTPQDVNTSGQVSTGSGEWPSDEEFEAAFSDWYETAHTPDTLAGWLDCWKSVTEWLQKRMRGEENI